MSWRSVLALTASYGLVFGMVLWAPDAHWGVMLVRNVPSLVLLIPLVALAVWSGIRRRPWPALVCSAGFAIGILTIGGLRLPQSRAVPEGRVLRVMSYNIAHGVAGHRTVAEAILTLRPDICCLQEGSIIWDSDGDDEAFHALLTDYEIVKANDMIVLSRFPVVGHTFTLTSESQPKICQVVDLDVEGTIVRVANVHWQPVFGGRKWEGWSGTQRWLEAHAKERRLQPMRTLACLHDPDVPTILCGDLNGPPLGPSYAAVRRTFRDAFADAGVGFGYTLTAGFPLRRIDYVFCRSGLVPVACEVPDIRASDHRPVLATLMLERG